MNDPPRRSPRPARGAPRRCCARTTSTSASARPRCSRASTSRSRKARWSRSSAPAARARPPSCAASTCSRSTSRARSSVGGETIGYRTAGGRRRRLGEGAISAQRARIGMVFQSFNLFPHMTARENVMLGLTKVAGPRQGRGARDRRALAHPGRARRPPGPLPLPALGRPAAAGRDRARDRDGADA